MFKYFKFLCRFTLLLLMITVQTLNYRVVSPKAIDSGENGYYQRRCNQIRVSANSTLTERTRMGGKPQTWFESTLKYLHKMTKRIIHVSKVYSFPVVDSEDVIEFDPRRREDTYRRTSPAEYPYAVDLLSVFSDVKRGCSGSLITEEWVITVSHCLYDATATPEVWVYAGGSSTNEIFDFLDNNKPIPETAQLIKAGTIVCHPKYATERGSYDVGLVKASIKFKMTPTVSIVNVTQRPWLYKGYRTCVDTAFGIVKDDTASDDDYVRKTYTFEVKKPCTCYQVLRLTDAQSRFLCAKPMQDYGICSGDSGGGLVCDSLLVGINEQTVAFEDINKCVLDDNGGECGGKNVLSMFIDVFIHLPWINSQVNLFTKERLAEIENPSSAGSNNSSTWVLIMIIFLVNLLPHMDLL